MTVCKRRYRVWKSKPLKRANMFLCGRKVVMDKCRLTISTLQTAVPSPAFRIHADHRKSVRVNRDTPHLPCLLDLPGFYLPISDGRIFLLRAHHLPHFGPYVTRTCRFRASSPGGGGDDPLSRRRVVEHIEDRLADPIVGQGTSIVIVAAPDIVNLLLANVFQIRPCAEGQVDGSSRNKRRVFLIAAGT